MLSSGEKPVASSVAICAMFSLPPAVKARVGIEAGVEQGWGKWLGDNGIFIGMSTFGASAPAKICFEKFGITVEKTIEAAKKSIASSK